MCEVAGWITPVPGGVGPMTVAMLMNNALRCAIQLQLKVRVFSTFIVAFAYCRLGKFSLLKVLLLSCVNSAICRIEIPFPMVSLFSEIESISFWPKTLDYSKAFAGVFLFYS